MSGDEGHAVRARAVRERYAKRCGAADAGGDPRHHFDGYAGGLQARELLAAAAENERIAALQPRDHVPRAREMDHEPLDEILRRRSAAAALADLDHSALRERETAPVDELIDEHHIGFAKRAHRAQRQELWIAGSRADEINHWPLTFASRMPVAFLWEITRMVQAKSTALGQRRARMHH